MAQVNLQMTRLPSKGFGWPWNSPYCPKDSKVALKMAHVDLRMINFASIWFMLTFRDGCWPAYNSSLPAYDSSWPADGKNWPSDDLSWPLYWLLWLLYGSVCHKIVQVGLQMFQVCLLMDQFGSLKAQFDAKRALVGLQVAQFGLLTAKVGQSWPQLTILCLNLFLKAQICSQKAKYCLCMTLVGPFWPTCGFVWASDGPCWPSNGPSWPLNGPVGLSMAVVGL